MSTASLSSGRPDREEVERVAPGAREEPLAGPASPNASTPRPAYDPLLRAFCVLGALLGCYGLWWGWVECWNPDQMALAPLRQHLHGLLPEPVYQFKPPFHTYLTHFAVMMPLRMIDPLVKAATGHYGDFQLVILYGARLLQLALFLGCIVVGYRIARRAFGLPAARLVALFTTTSAGIVLQAHFLTADIPVTLWMLVALLAAQAIATTGRLRAYLAAGLLTGLATATKYNGLAVGLAIPLFHWMANRERPFLRMAFDRRLILGVGAVLVGFVLANPFAVLKARSFAADFYYNYVTTPVYGGQDPGGNSFIGFGTRVVEIIGWPAAIVLLAGIVGTLVSARASDRLPQATLVAAGGVFLLYFFKFGSMPRIEARFVLPIVPLLFLLAAPALAAFVARHRRAGVAVIAAVAGYNILASGWVGHRFAHDPRMHAQAWVAQHLPDDATIESSYYTPFWNKYPGIKVRDVRMPDFFAKEPRLAAVFASRPELAQLVRDRESEAGAEWFQPAALAARRPDYIALDSLYYQRLLTPPNTEAYPEIAAYFRRLLDGGLGYEIVFDRSETRAPAWLYPREIGFVDNRILLLERREPLAAHHHGY